MPANCFGFSSANENSPPDAARWRFVAVGSVDIRDGRIQSRRRMLKCMMMSRWHVDMLIAKRSYFSGSQIILVDHTARCSINRISDDRMIKYRTMAPKQR